MSKHLAVIEWNRNGQTFSDAKYSRSHLWRFDGGAIVPASASPEIVRIPYSEPANVDPEEAYVAALASCHMLWFLSLAAKAGFVVDSYRDEAVGALERVKETGQEWMARVVLKSHVVFSGLTEPADDDVTRLHHEAHENCFLANSVKTEIEVQGSWDYRGKESDGSRVTA